MPTPMRQMDMPNTPVVPDVTATFENGDELPANQVIPTLDIPPRNANQSLTGYSRSWLSGSNSAVLDDRTCKSKAHANQSQGTLHVPEGHIEPSAMIEPEDCGTCNASQWGKPKGRGRDQMRLRAFPIHERPEDEDEAERDHAEDGEREHSRDGAGEAQHSSRTDQCSREPILVQRSLIRADAFGGGPLRRVSSRPGLEHPRALRSGEDPGLVSASRSPR